MGQKGDNKAGGGGPRGGGGKRTESPYGWEKGDVVRGVARVRPEVNFPRKPGREVLEPDPDLVKKEETAEPSERSIFAVLRALDAKLLSSLRKLEDTSVNEPERRRMLLERTGAQIDHHHRIEDDLFVELGDRPELRGDIASHRALDQVVSEQLERLRHTAPDDKAFSLNVRLLHGALDRRVAHDTTALLRNAERVLDPERAHELVDSLGV